VRDKALKNFLAIDTSGDYLCVVAVKNGVPFYAYESDCAMKHSVLFMGKVEEALAKAQMTLEECDFFAACVGAGSFTGIRIGISAVKGFALACNKPTLPVTSFDIAAYNALGANGEKTLALVDAKHGFYYARGYENGKEILQPSYISEAEVLALEAEGFQLCACEISPIFEKANVQRTVPIDGLFGAVKVLSEQNSFGQLQALYVRKSSAEENLTAKKA
jgi:tRNA threonylcarbamoyl adenosine modification protein YeaZ